MKSLKQYINESIVNESNPRGTFKVIKPMPTDSLWEYYAVINKDNSQIDYEDLRDICDEAGFEDFLQYAERKKWKTDKSKRYYIIPKGTKLSYAYHLKYASHIGLFEINDDGVYIPFLYDSINYGDYDEYLKEI